MRPNTPPKFQNQPLSETKQKHLILLFEECEELTERELRCPYCEFSIENVFSDLTGHIRVKCPKCRASMVLSLAYFRRAKRYRKIKNTIE